MELIIIKKQASGLTFLLTDLHLSLYRRNETEFGALLVW